MLNAFVIRDQRLTQTSAEGAKAPLEDAVWIDLYRPSDEERDRIETLYRQDFPEPDEVEEIEASARFFEDEVGMHLNSYFLQRSEGRIRNATIAFTLSGGRLFTLRDFESASFRMFRLRARREEGNIVDPTAILLALFETKVEELADFLEEVHTGLERLGTLVLEESDTELEDAIDELGRQEDINGKIRLCLMDTQRALNFLLRRRRLSPEHAEQVREILRDIESLLPHSTFLFEKVNFLMDAAQGFINIEQNQIIKIFSVAAVVFLPPTLIASIYGMNFHFLPELSLKYGYPMSRELMVCSAIAPYLYFKRRGWL